jgi:hypothetical protein
MMSRILILSILIHVIVIAMAQKQINVEISDLSEVNILGTSNIIPFRLTQKMAGFTGKQQTVYYNRTGNRIFMPENSIAIPVQGFESDNKMALRDFKKLVNSKQYPKILLVIKQFHFLCNIAHENKISLPVEITIADHTKPYQVTLETHIKDQILHIRGVRRVSIKDFGLVPPVTMMGLIRVSEWIEIQIKAEFKIAQYLNEKLQNTIEKIPGNPARG